MVADVAGRERAQYRIGERVQGDVGVAVAGQAPIVRHAHAAEPELRAGREARDVEAEADARAISRAASARRKSAS